MKQTEKLNLKKPDLTDYVNVSDINENMDILDAAVGKLNEGSTEIDDLQTVDKTLAGAINELKNDLATHLEDPNKPTKAVQDEINSNVKIVKENVDNVKTNVDNVNANVSTVKNLLGTANPTTANETTIMNFLKKIHQTQLPVGGLKPVITTGEIIGSSNVFKEVLRVSGSGFLKKAAVVLHAAAGFNTTLEVLVDGVKIYASSYSRGGGSLWAGYGIVDQLFYNSTQGGNSNGITVGRFQAQPFVSPTMASKLGYTTGTPVVSSFPVVIDLHGSKIPFNNSLVVQIRTDISATALGEYEVAAEVY